MSDLTITTPVQRLNDILSSEIDNEIVMLNLATGFYHGIDSIGSEIWELLGEAHTVQAVCQVLVERYEVDEATCQADVLAFVQQLEREGLVNRIG